MRVLCQPCAPRRGECPSCSSSALDTTLPALLPMSGKINITSQIMDLFNKRYQEKSGKAKPKK